MPPAQGERQRAVGEFVEEVVALLKDQLGRGAPRHAEAVRETQAAAEMTQQRLAERMNEVQQMPAVPAFFCDDEDVYPYTFSWRIASM